jgi:sulfite exporter TauE/SafE
MSGTLPLFAAAFLAGLLGSAHCLGMCAGISGLAAAHAGAASLRGQLPLTLVYNAGRVLSYALLGAIVGGFGGVVVRLSPAIAGPVRIISGIVIVLVGLRVAFDLRVLDAVERSGAALWQRIAPAARGLVPVTSAPRALGLGLLWGLLPCGLVYSALLIAATAATPVGGAAVMLAFGVGTLPAMVTTGLGAGQLSRFAKRRYARIGLGLVICALGLLTIATPLANRLTETAHSHMQGRHLPRP